MKFYGTFIGVDRYQSHDIGFLSSAVRDATALHALFADGFGGEPVLLADADAATSNIIAELQRLATVSSDEDLMVVSFSGHGSTTHELVSYDVDRSRLAKIALPLEKLAKLLNQIPAATLVWVLDCCFSGRFGAKVLVAPVQARGLESESDLLEQIAGSICMLWEREPVHQTLHACWKAWSNASVAAWGSTARHRRTQRAVRLLSTVRAGPWPERRLYFRLRCS